MNDAKVLQVVEQPTRTYNRKKKSKIELKNLRSRNYRSNTSDELVNLEPCPRSVDDVYALGVRIQYYIGAVYLELDAMNRGSKPISYTSMALRQLEGKEEIEKLVNDNLNRLLGWFYNNGGAIIEAPVSQALAQELQPFFNRVLANFLYQLDSLMKMTAKGDISVSDLDESINNNIIALYTVLGKLFKVDDIKDAFNDLICIRRALTEQS